VINTVYKEVLFMSIEAFIVMLHNYIREEFLAVSEVKDNVIKIRFNDGKVITIVITEKG